MDCVPFYFPERSLTYNIVPFSVVQCILNMCIHIPNWSVYFYQHFINIFSIFQIWRSHISSLLLHSVGRKNPLHSPTKVAGGQEHLPHGHQEEKKSGFDQPISFSSKIPCGLFNPLMHILYIWVELVEMRTQIALDKIVTKAVEKLSQYTGCC